MQPTNTPSATSPSAKPPESANEREILPRFDGSSTVPKGTVVKVEVVNRAK